MPEERVQKILARAGYGSRRSSEELILAGRVKVNGQVAVLGTKADLQRDTVTVDNEAISKKQELLYIALNKPTGVLSEVSDKETRDTVRDLVPVPGHLFIVGRLDLESEGLILLTNDGDLANRLTHPRYGHEKEYRVMVGTRPDEKQLDAWRHGVVLEDGYRTQPAQVRLESVSGKIVWLRVILREGRKRQIREMGRLTGLPVLRIQRIRIGSLLLGELKPGEWRNLRPEEVRALQVNKPYKESRPMREIRGVRQSGPARGSRQGGDLPAWENRSSRGSGSSRTSGSVKPGGFARPANSTRPGVPARSTNSPRTPRSGPAGQSIRSDRPQRSSDRPPRSSDRSSRGGGRKNNSSRDN